MNEMVHGEPDYTKRTLGTIVTAETGFLSGKRLWTHDFQTLSLPFTKNNYFVQTSGNAAFMGDGYAATNTATANESQLYKILRLTPDKKMGLAVWIMPAFLGFNYIRIELDYSDPTGSWGAGLQILMINSVNYQWELAYVNSAGGYTALDSNAVVQSGAAEYFPLKFTADFNNAEYKHAYFGSYQYDMTGIPFYHTTSPGKGLLNCQFSCKHSAGIPRELDIGYFEVTYDES